MLSCHLTCISCCHSVVVSSYVHLYVYPVNCLAFFDGRDADVRGGVQGARFHLENDPQCTTIHIAALVLISTLNALLFILLLVWYLFMDCRNSLWCEDCLWNYFW